MEKDKFLYTWRPCRFRSWHEDEDHFHFVTGGTLINVVFFGTLNSFQYSPFGNYGAEVANGINVDFGKHFGIDILIFTPTIWPSETSHSLLLDFRYVF